MHVCFIHAHIYDCYDCSDVGMQPHVYVCVCGMPRIVALAINLRHSQPKKKIMLVRQKKQGKRRKTLFSFFLSLPFANLMGFWALI